MQAMSASLFERLVLSKPYFDNRGLILAVDDGRPVGFVHGGFGPNAEETALSTLCGVTCMVMVRPEYRRLGIGSELLARSEAYLTQCGAQVLYGGGIRPLNPFYLGLYGGSELPGVLDSDAEAQALYRSAGYVDIDHTVILQRDLRGFRPPVDRQMIQVRRQMVLRETIDPPTTTWWQACTFGDFDRTRFDLVARDSGARCATATVWSIEPLATSWGVRAVGLIDVEVNAAYRRQGLATFLISEVMRELSQGGVGLIEVQTMSHNLSALALYAKLGYREVDRGTVFRKEATS